jgi:hypothetical protein
MAGLPSTLDLLGESIWMPPDQSLHPIAIDAPEFRRQQSDPQMSSLIGHLSAGVAVYLGHSRWSDKKARGLLPHVYASREAPSSNHSGVELAQATARQMDVPYHRNACRS